MKKGWVLVVLMAWMANGEAYCFFPPPRRCECGLMRSLKRVGRRLRDEMYHASQGLSTLSELFLLGKYFQEEDDVPSTTPCHRKLD